MPIPVKTIARLMLFSGVLVLGSVATSCFLESRVVLTPSPSGRSSIQSRAIAVTDSVAKQHGLKPKRPWFYCSVRGTEGTPEAAWGSGSLSLTACGERAEPARMEIQIRNDGFRWNAKGDSIREQLPAALRAAFGLELATVTVDPK